MQVDGPNKRELASVLAQLRHLYMLMQRNSDLVALADGILARQISRLESLDRVLFDKPEPQQAKGASA